MTERRWERLAPLTGVVAIILLLVAVLILEGSDRPQGDAPGQELAAYYEDEQGSIFMAFFFWALGSAFLVWFLGTLRSVLALAEGGVGRIATIAFGGGVAAAAFVLAIPTPEVAATIAADEGDRGLGPDAAIVFWNVGTGFFLVAEVMAAVLLVATAVVALRTRVLPAWLAWVSLVFGVALLILPIGWAVLIFGVPLWILAVGLLLWQRSEPVSLPAA